MVEFTKAIEIDPKDIPALENRGYMYLALQKYAEASADFTKVIELAPKQSTAYLGRGQAETQLKQFDPALADLTKAIELKPEDSNAYRFRGFAYIGKKRLERRDRRLRQGDRGKSKRPTSVCLARFRGAECPEV